MSKNIFKQAVSGTFLAVLGLGSVMTPAKTSAQTYENIPLLLPRFEVHVCDVTNAGTDDDVTVKFGVGSSVYSYLLDNPGDDFERNTTNNFAVSSIGPATAQMSDLKYIKVTKPGGDGLCIDRVAMYLQETKVWEYKTADAYTGTYFGSGNGDIFLDSDSGVEEVRFSDITLTYPTGTTPLAGPVDVTVKTCDATNAQSAGALRLYWEHDGMPEPYVALGSSHAANEATTYRISAKESVGTLSNLSLKLLGTDGLCVDYVWVRVNGTTILFNSDDTWLDSTDAKAWNTYDLATNSQVQTGGATLRLGRALQRVNYASTVQNNLLSPAGWTTPIAICNPPAVVNSNWFRDMTKTQMAPVLRDYGASWASSGYASVIGHDKNTIHSRIRFEHEAPGAGNAVLWIDYDMDFACTAKDGITITPTHLATDHDAPLITQAIEWLVESIANIDVDALLLKGVKGAMKSITMDMAGGACPELLVQQDNSDLRITWDAKTLSFPNGMCFQDSSTWPKP